MTSSDEDLARALNQRCACVGVDQTALVAELARETGDAESAAAWLAARPHLFSDSPVFVSERDAARMIEIIDAIESVVALPAYRQRVQSAAPESARVTFGPRGVFLGYDFHLSPAGPRLIEINTNAGGPLLNAVLARSHHPCCPEVEPLIDRRAPSLESAFVEMFREEWRRQRGANATLRRIAIVDDAPAEQYLYPEFVLFARLFERHGIAAPIVDPRDLVFRDGRLWSGDQSIDLVYNRLTDFALAAPEHAALRAAYLDGAVVVTPHPAAHALYADKRNLAVLGDRTQLSQWGAAASQVEVLTQGIARTRVVRSVDAELLWADRKTLFFKPAGGYGSKATYRGDKLTRRVFEEILRADYVAQELVAPGERVIPGDADPNRLKLDVRAYVYDGRVQLYAARLYQGQTTNFRTPGGGFAPVFVIADTINNEINVALRKRKHV